MKPNTVGALPFDDFEEHLLVKLVGIAVPVGGLTKCLVKRHIADRKADRRQDLPPYPVQITADGQLHKRVRTSGFGRLGFPDLRLQVHDVRGGADRCVDFCPQPHADPYRVRPAVSIDRQNDLSLGNPCHNLLGIEPFSFGN